MAQGAMHFSTVGGTVVVVVGGGGGLCQAVMRVDPTQWTRRYKVNESVLTPKASANIQFQ